MGNKIRFNAYLLPETMEKLARIRRQTVGMAYHSGAISHAMDACVERADEREVIRKLKSNN